MKRKFKESIDFRNKNNNFRKKSKEEKYLVKYRDLDIMDSFINKSYDDASNFCKG